MIDPQCIKLESGRIEVPDEWKPKKNKEIVHDSV